jgi:transposase
MGRRGPQRRLLLEPCALIAAYQAGARSSELARLYGCSWSTVLKRLREGGVELHGPQRRLLLEPRSLITAYQAGTSALELARRYGCSLNVVLSRLREVGVRIRPAGERHTVKELGLNPSKAARFKEIVDGLLLGDGCINNAGVLQVAQSVRRVGWLRAIMRLCSELEIACGMTPARAPKRVSYIEGRPVRGGASRTFYAHTYKETKEQRLRWYPHGTKRVPRDFVVTPLSVALWYCGDGTGSKNGTMEFCTQGFLRADVCKLARRLAETFQVHAYVGQATDGPVVRIDRRDDAFKIKQLIKAFVPRCCVYKLKYIRPAIPRGRALRRLTPAQVRRIREASGRGVTGSVLSRRYGVSEVSIGNIVKRKIYRDVS